MIAYLAYFSNLSEDEAVIIDKEVFENREEIYIFVKNLLSNAKYKTKRLIIVSCLGVGLWFSNVQRSEAIGLSTPSRPIVRVEPSHEHTFELRTTIKVARRNNCITYISNRKILLIYLTDPRISSNKEILKFTKELQLRGGSLSLIVGLGLIGLAVLIMAFSGAEVESFIPAPGWGLNRPDPFQPPGGPPKFPPYYDLLSPSRTSGSPRYPSTLQITRPSAMPQSDFSALSKVDKRRLYDIRDMKIKHKGYPELDVGFWQAEYKVRKHGAIHGLEYTIHEKNGGTITKKTEENVLKMMRSIVDLANRDQVEWFVNGTYQGGTERQFEAIHVYDPFNQIIVVFEKSTRKFVTTCQLTLKQDTELKATGNFGGGENWFSKQAQNLPPLQYFESDVKEMTPISPMNTLSNLGFTPINSFESDVMNITPRDNP